jgi:hypothetical protein
MIIQSKAYLLMKLKKHLTISMKIWEVPKQIYTILMKKEVTFFNLDEALENFEDYAIEEWKQMKKRRIRMDIS